MKPEKLTEQEKHQEMFDEIWGDMEGIDFPCPSCHEGCDYCEFRGFLDENSINYEDLKHSEWERRCDRVLEWERARQEADMIFDGNKWKGGL